MVPRQSVARVAPVFARPGLQGSWQKAQLPAPLNQGVSKLASSAADEVQPVISPDTMKSQTRKPALHFCANIKPGPAAGFVAKGLFILIAPTGNGNGSSPLPLALIGFGSIP